ncbi:MAG: tetratricopeptide repeat protein [Rikenellaceae bacterium]
MKKFIATIILFISVFSMGIGEVSAQYNQDYFYWVSRQKMMRDDFHGAISVLNMLIGVNDKLYEAYFLRGIAKYNLNDLIGADNDFTIALEKNPVFTTAYTYRAITRSRMGNYNDALEDFAQAIELRPDIANPYYSRGVTRLLNRQYEEAIEDFDKFIRAESKVADAYINRALCYLNLSDTTAAYRNLDQAVMTNRENPDSYNRRGALYMHQKRYGEAEEDFDMAIRNDSTYIRALFNRALIYNETKRPTLALRDFDRVIELDTTSSLSYFNRAIIRSQVGDYNRALEDYNVVARYSPSNVLVFFYRANLLSRLGDIDAAEADYSRAIELYPDFANAYMSRANIRYLKRDNVGARRDRTTAERKIEEHRSKLKDSTYSIYSDTTYQFDKLLSFDTNLSGSSFEKITSTTGGDSELALIPLFKFTLMTPDGVMTQKDRYYAPRAESFVESMRASKIDIELTHKQSNISIDSLAVISKNTGDSWESIFGGSIVQLLMKQYTKSMQFINFTIKDINSENPFFYLNRATTRAEMIDFISSLDSSTQRISIDSDPANRLKNSNSKRNYNYDESLADLDRCIELYPSFAHSYYNKANLLAKSGKYPEAYEEYSKAIELYPSFAEAYYNRGIVQIYMEDTRKGCLDISKAGELGIGRAYEILKEYASKIE